MSEETLEDRLIAAMAEMVNPTKSNTATVPTKSGGRYTYKYESLDQVLAAVRPPLLEHGIGLIQQQVLSEKTGRYVLRTEVFSGTDHRVVDERPMVETSDPQAAGSWETYMRRYALRCAFGLCGEDDDGAAAKASPQKKTAPPAPDRDERRNRMLARCAELSVKCVENGMNAGATEKYMRAHYHVEAIADLTDEQLLEFGRYLKSMEEQSRKLEKDEQQ